MMQENYQSFKSTPGDFCYVSNLTFNKCLGQLETHAVVKVWRGSATAYNSNMNSFLQQPCFVLCIPTAQVADEKTEKNRNFDR